LEAKNYLIKNIKINFTSENVVGSTQKCSNDF